MYDKYLSEITLTLHVEKITNVRKKKLRKKNEISIPLILSKFDKNI